MMRSNDTFIDVKRNQLIRMICSKKNCAGQYAANTIDLIRGVVHRHLNEINRWNTEIGPMESILLIINKMQENKPTGNYENKDGDNNYNFLCHYEKSLKVILLLLSGIDVKNPRHVFQLHDHCQAFGHTMWKRYSDNPGIPVL